MLFDDFLTDPADDGDEFPPEHDNCDFVSNPSQSDGDGDGVGDACDSNPFFRVSTDPLDDPDFDNVQDAVDAAMESGTSVLIFPGLDPPYFESTRVDRNQVFHFLGVDLFAHRGEARQVGEQHRGLAAFPGRSGRDGRSGLGWLCSLREVVAALTTELIIRWVLGLAVWANQIDPRRHWCSATGDSERPSIDRKNYQW